MNNIFSVIEQEITNYLGAAIEITEGVTFSQWKLVRRIYLFKNKTYPTGKIDKQGNYKYWFDIIKPRMDNEVKNIDIDTKDILIFSDNPVKDFAPVFISNASMKEWLWDTGRAEEMNAAAELYSGDGNIVFKKVKGGYQTCDPLNTYITIQTAETLDDTAIIERHQLTQSELRSKRGVWNDEAIEEVIKYCGDKTFSPTKRTGLRDTTNPYYEIFERTGEVTEAALFEAQGKEAKGDDTKYVLAKVICAGLKRGGKDYKYVLFAEALPAGKKISNYYVEAHRGAYKGRWWREGMYELLFDHQVRANEIGNQLARGLEWASKTFFKSVDVRTIQSLKTDLVNGDIIKSGDLAQVEVRMQGLDQLIADWNRLMADADAIANSYEVVSGGNLPAGTPFRLGQLLDVNANKLFVFLRQKLGIAYKRVFREWILPELVKDLRGKQIFRLTGDEDLLNQFYEIAANNWYIDNLVKIGPHTPEIAELLKAEKIEELKRTDPLIENSKEIWDQVLQRLYVTITGENTDLAEQLETVANILQFEQDPARRAFLLDLIYKTKGIPTPPEFVSQQDPLPEAQPGAVEPVAQPV